MRTGTIFKLRWAEDPPNAELQGKVIQKMNRELKKARFVPLYTDDDGFVVYLAPRYAGGKTSSVKTKRAARQYQEAA